MPEYTYRCPHGHDTTIWTTISDKPDVIPCAACNAEAAPRIALTQRPVVKGGTENFHGRAGVK